MSQISFNLKHLTMHEKILIEVFFGTGPDHLFTSEKGRLKIPPTLGKEDMFCQE